MHHLKSILFRYPLPRNKKTECAIKILLFLLSPFVSFLYSLLNIKSRSSYVVFFLFCVFFGMAFSIDEDALIDGRYYREVFEYYEGVSWSGFVDNFNSYLKFSDGEKDFYHCTVSFFVSRFTSNYHYVFMVYAFVFSFFCLKSLKFLTDEDKFDASISSYILVFLFTFNQIFNINGVRFWTAAWIAVYCIFQIFRNNKKRYFILAIIAPPFIHASYLTYVLLITFVFIMKNSFIDRYLSIIFVLSFILSPFALTFVSSNASVLPGSMGILESYYATEETVETISAQGTGFWIVGVIFKYIKLVYINFLVLLFIKNSKLLLANPMTRSLYIFLLIWMSAVNFLMPVPSVGVRFIELSYPIIAYLWLVAFKGYKYQGILYLCPFAFFMAIYRLFINYTTVTDLKFYTSSSISIVYHYLLSPFGM